MITEKTPRPWEVLRRLADRLEQEGLAGFEGMLVAVARSDSGSSDSICLLHTMCDHDECNLLRVRMLENTAAGGIDAWLAKQGSNGNIPGLTCTDGHDPGACAG